MLAGSWARESQVRRVLIWEYQCEIGIREFQHGPCGVLVRDLACERFSVPGNTFGNIFDLNCDVMQAVEWGGTVHVGTGNADWGTSFYLRGRVTGIQGGL